MKKTKLTRSLLAACSIVALSAVAYGCSSGISQGEADKQAAEAAAAAAAAAKAEAEAAAAEAAKKAAEQAEKDKQAALEAQNKAARADAQKQVIMDAAAAAGTAVDAVGIGASDADITAAEAAIAAVTTAIEAAVDVDDTSMYTAQVASLDTRLMTAKSLVMQERADRKAERAAAQQGDIDDAISDAQDAVALVVEGASNEVIEAAEAAVQDARDAITAAVDVEDTSGDTATVDGIAGDLTTAKDTVLADRLQDRIDMQQGAIDAAIKKAQSAAAKVVLGASDEDIAAAETAVKLAEDAIAAAEDVEDTSGDTATVNGIKSGLATAKTLVIADRAAKKAARAENQKTAITGAITAANTAIEELALTSSDDDIAAAEMKVQAITAAITAAVDVSEDEKAAYTAQVGNIQASLMTSKTLILSNRTIRAGEETAAINTAITAAQTALAAVDADAEAADETAAAAAIKAVDDLIDAAVYADTTELAASAGDLDDELAGRKAIRAAIAAAKEAIDGVDADASDGDVSDAEDAVDAVQEAIDAAMHLTDEEKAAFEAVINDDDTGLDDMLAAAKTKRTTDMAAADKENMSRAQGLATALGDASGGTGVAGSFNSTSTSTDATMGNVTATHDGSKVTTTLGTVAGVTGDNTPAFTQDDDGPMALSGWHGSSWTRSTTQHVTVYHDIEAPTATLFSSVSPYNNLTNRAYTVPTNTYTALAKAGSFPATPTKNDTASRTYVGAADRTFTGSYQGGAGSYTCTGTTCSVQVNDSGQINFGADGTWVFTFDEGAKVDVSDADYVHFGWWMIEPSSATGTYEFASFYGDNTGSAAQTHDDLTGKATYNGKAAGVYAAQDLQAGVVTGASKGEFTADARLTAAFGAATENGTIAGVISNFEDQDGGALSGWRVTLDGAALGNDSNAAFGSTTDGTMGGASELTGRWRGNFYDDSGPDDADKPDAVAGQFDAMSSGAWIHGVFGANR